MGSKTALISVYNKDGIVEFAEELHKLGFDILASGGTAKKLTEAKLPVRDVSELVGGKAILGHRVVTLSREVHAGLLAQDNKEDRAELEKMGVPFIDLVCVDLYPLKEEIKNKKSTRESVIEKTDIGGPTMLRSAAKGRRIVVSDPADRMRVLEWLKRKEPEKETFITGLCAKAEAVVAEYCLWSARYHSQGGYDGFLGREAQQCLYGENAWQTPAALFAREADDPLAIANFELVAGTAPSYNNLCDLDRMLQTATHIAAAFDVNAKKVPLIAVGAKHGNACGAAIGTDPEAVLKAMLEGDLRAIFGGLVLTNFPITEKAAETLLTHKMSANQRRLLDGVIAPDFKPEAVKALSRKGDKCRFLKNPALGKLSKETMDSASRFRYVRGGFLKQPNYNLVIDLSGPNIEKIGELTPQRVADLLLAWAVGSTSNSNTVALVRDGMLVGNGVGQQDRVGGCELAIKRAKDAGHETVEAVAYSDSFFPFTDGPKALADAGISAVFASSGSVKDEEVKKFCREQGMTLVLVPDKLGRGFFGH